MSYLTVQICGTFYLLMLFDYICVTCPMSITLILIVLVLFKIEPMQCALLVIRL